MTEHATMASTRDLDIDTARIRALAVERAASFPPLSREQATLVRAMLTRRPAPGSTPRASGDSASA